MVKSSETPTQSELLDVLSELQRHVAELENDVVQLRRKVDASIPEDVLLAIIAGVSAYMGTRAKIKAVTFNRHKTFASQGRLVLQDHDPARR